MHGVITELRVGKKIYWRPSESPWLGSGEAEPLAGRRAARELHFTELSRHHNQLIQWRDRFLPGGETGLKSREADVEDEERWRLKSLVASVGV